MPHAADLFTNVEFLRFLRAIDRDTPNGLDLHLIVDNYATHKYAKVKVWLKRRPRFHRGDRQHRLEGFRRR